MKVAPEPDDERAYITSSTTSRSTSESQRCSSKPSEADDPNKPDLPLWGHLVVLAAVALPTAGLTLTFSIMGYGEYIYVGLVDLQSRLNLFTYAVGISLLLAALLYVLDASYWTGVGVSVRRVASSVAGAALGINWISVHTRTFHRGRCWSSLQHEIAKGIQY